MKILYEQNYTVHSFYRHFQTSCDEKKMDKADPDILPVTELRSIDTSVFRSYVTDIQAIQNVNAGADVAAARASFYPTLTLTPCLGLNSFKLLLLLTGGSITYGLVASLTAPIFNQELLKRVLSIAEANKQDAYCNYKQTILNGS